LDVVNEGREAVKSFNLKARYFPISHGAIHAVIDASTIMVVFSATVVHRFSPFQIAFMIGSYDLLAFAGQGILGFGVDKLRLYKSTILLGIALTAISVVLMLSHPFTAMVVAGLGNALFHVGAGAISLNTTPGRATDPGIFVAPGALGLGLGLWLGKSGNTLLWPFLLALALSFAIAIKSTLPVVEVSSKPKLFSVRGAKAVLLLLLVSISIRAFVGFAGTYESPKLPMISFGLAFAAFAGKALGGIISDQLGWIRTSVGALLISAPFIAFGNSNGSIIIVGMFFFQMTMPVTLTAVHALMPTRPAFSFGLCSTALIVGSFVSFYEPWVVYYNSYTLLGLISLSAISIFVALNGLKERIPMKFAMATN
jgi:FSR family fosmidomycin resistance protein-like MFS transporter